MTEEDLRELEWAASYLQHRRPSRGCRCAGSCDDCRAYDSALRKIGPGAVLKLIDEVKRLKMETTK